MNAFVQSIPVLSTTTSATSSSWTCPQTQRTPTSSPPTTTTTKNSGRRHHSIRMDVETEPDLQGPDTAKYLQFIPSDRLNKSPVITVNSFKNPAYNNVSIIMPTLLRDVPAGDSVKDGVMSDVDLTYVDDRAPPSKWAKYYPVESVNQAPLISINYSPKASPSQCGVLVVGAATVFPTAEAAKAILDGDDEVLDPQLYKAYINAGDGEGGTRLNKAPYFTIVAPEETGPNENGYVSYETTNVPLDTHSAELILNTYRK